MLKKNKENLSSVQPLNVQQAAEYLGVHEGTIRRFMEGILLIGS